MNTFGLPRASAPYETHQIPRQAAGGIEELLSRLKEVHFLNQSRIPTTYHLGARGQRSLNIINNHLIEYRECYGSEQN